MKTSRFRIAAIILLQLSTAFASEVLPAQGLRFNGLEKKIDERTSLEIHNIHSKDCKDSLSIAFDLKFFKESLVGYIFQLKTGKAAKDPTIILYYGDDLTNGHLRIILEGKRFISELVIPDEKSQNGWMRFKLTLDQRKDSVFIEIPGIGKSAGYLDLPGKIHPDLNFGKRNNILEVPSMAIRNLTIGIDKDRITFPLNEDSGNKAISNKLFVYAHVTNPRWIANDCRHWKKEFQIKSESYLCGGYDTSRHQFYAVSEDSVFIENFVTKVSSSRPLKERCPVTITLGTSFVNPSDRKLYVYEMFYRDTLAGTPTMASMDFDSLTWSPVTDQQVNMQLHHHAEWLDTANHRFRIYGGFGNSSYSGIFRDFDLKTKEWKEVPVRGDGTLWPRFFQAMGYDQSDRRLYIFGGMGNEIGDQIIGHEYFYDLHVIDPETMESKLLWNISWKGRDKVPARNMIIPGDGYIYVLFYPESLTESEVSLYRFSIKDGSFKELADHFPIYSDRISTNANFFYDKSQQSMVAMVEESEDDIHSKITVYSLSYPPKPLTTPTVVIRKIRWLAMAVIMIIMIGIGNSIFHKIRRKKAIKPTTVLDDTPTEPLKDSILLFGSFKAYGHEGQDITHNFSEKLRLLLYLLLQTGDSGLTSREISLLLWPDKEENESKNIRGVTISKLRKALSEISPVSVEFSEGRFRFRADKDFYCDMLAVQDILQSGHPDYNMLIRCLQKGKFLSYETDPLLDGMKNDMERAVEPVILKEMLSRFQKRLYKSAIDCGEILFWIDPLNDDALTYIVLSLRQMEMDTEARGRYNEFVKRYRKEYQEEYSRRYEDIKLLA